LRRNSSNIGYLARKASFGHIESNRALKVHFLIQKIIRGGNTTAEPRELAAEFKDGYVVTCDIVDFYNQIYLHRTENLIEEACGLAYAAHGKAMENFLLGLNTLTSRGIPVGPAPSIIIAELIAADIDKKILSYTDNFVRWVDDISIFFATKDEAERVLHELTAFVHSNHRLVFSGEKTPVLTVERFVRNMRDEEEEEQKLIKARAKERAMDAYWKELIEEIPTYDIFEPFDEERFHEVLETIQKDSRYEILSKSTESCCPLK